MVKKIVKMIGFTFLGVVVLITLIGIVFVNTSPQFGGSPGKDQLTAFSLLDNFKDGTFVNRRPAIMEVDYWDALKKFITGGEGRAPSRDVTVEELDSAVVDRADSITQLTWFGHSAFLLEIDGKKLFLDPMLGCVPAPHPWLGRRRFSSKLPLEIEKLPHLDAVIISHDHYDHLDYPSIKKLKDKVVQFFVPLGVGSHLQAWGVPEEKIQELNWWDTTSLDNIELVCTPARHFSGRGLRDRDVTLWASWVIKGTRQKIYFSGDSGYDDHFAEIGERHGPFDIALMECGQYNEQWRAIHMMPEETVQGAIDLNSKLVMPIHWGAFTLAFHTWTDPVERATKKAKELDIPIATPRIGEPLIIGAADFPREKWWEEFM